MGPGSFDALESDSVEELTTSASPKTRNRSISQYLTAPISLKLAADPGSGAAWIHVKGLIALRDLYRSAFGHRNRRLTSDVYE